MSTTILTGDCRTRLAKLPSASVQCCVTSPPYYGLRDYGVAKQIGLEASVDLYVNALVAVFREVRRVLREDGVCWLNIGDSYATGAGRAKQAGGGAQGAAWAGAATQPNRMPQPGLKPKDLMMVPARVALALQADGWWVRSDIIWHKPNPMPESIGDRPTSAHEHVFLLTKAERYFYDAEAIKEPTTGNAHPRGQGVNPKARANAAGSKQNASFSAAVTGTVATRNARNVWTIASQPCREAHFATMPQALAERCIAAGTSEGGACPHCGTAWERVMAAAEDDRPRAAYSAAAYGHGAAGRATKAPKVSIPGGSSLPVQRKQMIGWAPTCDCPAHQPVPQVVLDPFGGAGTTALAAESLGRDALLIELNPAYAAIARSRLARLEAAA